MDKIQMIMRKLFCIGLILIFILAGCESKEQREYLDSLNLKLWGVIESMDIPDSFNGFGVMDVSIINSNINYYDPRKKRKFYYCVIINNRAQFYPGDLRDCEIKDTIEIETKDRIFLVHKKNGEVLKKEMIQYTNEQFYRYVRKNYQHF